MAAAVGLVVTIHRHRMIINHLGHRRLRREERLPVSKDTGPGSGQVRLVVRPPATSPATEAGTSERNTGLGVTGMVGASGEVGIRIGASLGAMPGKEARGGMVVVRDRLVRPIRLLDMRVRVLGLPVGDDRATVETFGLNCSFQVFGLYGYRGHGKGSVMVCETWCKWQAIMCVRARRSMRQLRSKSPLTAGYF